MKCLFLLILMVHINRLSGQDVPADSQDSVTKEIYNKLNNSLLVDLYTEGEEFTTLLSQLNFNQLDSIIENGNAVSKVYGFWSYTKKEGSDYRSHFVSLVKDTTKVGFVQYGCIFQHPEEVGKVIFELAIKTPKVPDGYPDYEYFLDSIAFELDKRGMNYGNINIRLGNIQPPSDLYSKLRDRALTGDVSAIMGLANFKNESDLQIFNALIERERLELLYSLICIERFPHPSFQNTLLNSYYVLLNDPSAYRFSSTTKVLLKYSTEEVINAINTVVLDYRLYPNHLIALWKLTNTDIIKYKELRKHMLKVIGRKELNKMLYTDKSV